jgi:hypothetical protein
LVIDGAKGSSRRRELILWDPTENVRNFKDNELGKVVPHGVYDPTTNAGWVSVGIMHDTAEFAVQSIRTWLDPAVVH